MYKANTHIHTHTQPGRQAGRQAGEWVGWQAGVCYNNILNYETLCSVNFLESVLLLCSVVSCIDCR
jgi:hypothetical protein